VDEVVKEGDVSRVVVDERGEEEEQEDYQDQSPFLPNEEDEAGPGGAAGLFEFGLAAADQEPAVEQLPPSSAGIEIVEEQGEGDASEDKEAAAAAAGKKEAEEEERRPAVVQGGWLDGLEEAIL
jgi:hypothetical protein